MAAKFGLLIDAKTKGENNIKRLGNSMQGVEGKAKNLGMAVRGAGLAFKALFATAAVGSIIAIGKSAIDTADAFGKLSTRTGIAADKLLAYVNAGKLADVSQSDLETGLRTLARTQVEASEGVKTYADAYAKLGVTVKNQDGTLKDSDQLLSDIADRFQDLPNGPEKAAVAMDIFGRSGQKMITLLNGGSEALDEFGFELSENFARNSETFNDNLTKVGIEIDRLRMQVLDDLLPALIDLSETFIDITKSIRDAADAFAKFFGIGDEAMIAKNTIQIQALNKNIARTKTLLREQREEAAKGGDLFGIRTGQIQETERLLAEFESKREVLRREINQATAPVSVDVTEDDSRQPRSRFSSVSAKAKPEKAAVQASDKLLALTKQINAARISGNEFKLAGLEYDREILQIQEKGLTGNNLAIAQNNALTEFDLKRQQLLSGTVEKQKELNTETSKTEQLFASVKDTVATGLANAITGLIDGTKSLGESLSGILKQLGSMFLQFGMKSAFGAIFPSARGNVFAQNGIVPYANGGIINRPTRALMGEAGPEAVLPLQRGADGQLGVQVTGEADMRAAMGRYSRRGGTTAAAAAIEEGVAGFGGVGGSGAIDVRYNVERINSVDYVTAEEFQVGMQKAATQGAQRGQQLALGRLQQSPATRRRLGL